MITKGKRVRTGYDQARIGSVCRNLVNLQNAKKNCPPPWIAKKDKATPRICKKNEGTPLTCKKNKGTPLTCKKKWGYSSMQQWFHPIDGSVRQQSGEYPHFFLQKKKRVLLYAAEWFHPIDGSVRQLSGEYPHFFFASSRSTLIFFCTSRRRAIFFVSANLPIPTNWTSNSRSPVSVYRSGLKNITEQNSVGFRKVVTNTPRVETGIANVSDFSLRCLYIS